jgi:hypothetical protein
MYLREAIKYWIQPVPFNLIIYKDVLYKNMIFHPEFLTISFGNTLSGDILNAQPRDPGDQRL